MKFLSFKIEHPQNSAPVIPRVFTLLLFGFVLVRTLMLSSMLMPFEGWDEYQHLAVPAFIDKHGRLPTPDDQVPREMIGFLSSHPHPDYSARQLSGLGVRNYSGKRWLENGWISDRDQETIFSELPILYQSQHGSAYYRFMVFLKSILGLNSSLIWADLGRIANCLFAALTAVMWFLILSRFFQTGPLAAVPYLLCLGLASSSLFAYCHARVANDGLAIFLGSATLLWYVRYVRTGESWKSRWFLSWPAVLGFLTGLSVLGKSTAIVLVPVILLDIGFSALRHRIGLKRAAATLLIFFSAYLVVAGPYHMENYERCGTITGMQEAIRNTAEGRGINDLFGVLSTLKPYQVTRLFFYDVLHCGGWSYLRGPSWLRDGFAWFVQGCLVLILLALARPRTRRSLWSMVGRSRMPLLLLLFTWAALLYHLTHSYLAWGEVLTNPWYGLLALPALLLFLLLGAFSLWNRGAVVLGLALAAIFSLAYYLETFGTMLFHQTGLSGIKESMEKIQNHHILLKVPLELGLSSEVVFMGGLWTVTVYVFLKVMKSHSSEIPPVSPA